MSKMPAPTGPRRGGGIRKHQRRDRDGDLVMGATPAPRTTPKQSHSANLTELRVTGWTDKAEVQRVIQFLERHAAKRSSNASKNGPSNIIKRTRVFGDVLHIFVRSDDVAAFGKINGFSFASTHGSQKLSISGSGITSRDGASTEQATSSDGNKVEHMKQTIEVLRGFLSRRYDADAKLLNLSTITSDEEVRKLGMFETKSTQTKFIPVLMKLCDEQLPTAEAKRDAIHSITVSNNDLTNLTLVSDLSRVLPDTKNLDLSGNKIENTKDLWLWKNKFRRLEHLVLTNNPLETSQPNWEQEVIAWYPRLRLLNGREVRTEAQIALLDAPKQTPRPSNVNIWLDEGKVGENFLLEFFPGFDTDRNAALQKFYDNNSTFSLSVNARARGGAGNQHEKTPWDSYLPQSRNLKFISGKRTRFQRRSRGLDQIQKAWTAMPPTRHPPLGPPNYSMDCQPQPGVPDPSGQYPRGVTGLMITIHGEYEEHRTAKGADEVVRRAFDRTFVLGPGGPAGVRVVSDMLSLRAAGGTPAWVLKPKEEAMVAQVRQATKLKAEMAVECLKAGNWDMDAAAQIFNAQKDQLPPEAFDP
ncbi:NTF2-like protein [Aaosphaeria arxii CBS 175.79]|uniref:NTF2-like protein n=1 Tax=Aaosphaeria arxii CBS 175.79 TaxID=1450172 RepID=A0A6A5XIP8_9PLEO|nr:NTF2-like protein [Aaosphaeria arxii CBS 175.79]KAF2013155.1 NTF2-like protein [Aaosphaeria arxii CBS 175.79]